MEFHSLPELLEAEKEKFITNCSFCGLCLDVCPVLPLLEIENMSTSEAQEERISVLSGGPITDAVYDMVWSCSRCSNCLRVCPEELNPFLLQYILRSELVRKGRTPPISAPPQPLEPLSDDRIWTDRSNTPSKIDMVYFSGCNAARDPKLFSNTLDVFDAIGVDYLVLVGEKSEICCGSPHLSLGNPEMAETVARKLISTIARLNPKKLVVKCPACLNRLTHLHPRFLNFDFEVQSMSSFLLEYLDRIDFIHPIERTVTVHDSCNLGRAIGDFETVRKLLQSIRGIRLVEMANNRENADCCGLPTFRTYPEIAEKLTLRPLTDAKNTGAQVLVTSCGFCEQGFSMWIEKHGAKLPFQIKNFLVILMEAMGIVGPD